MLETNVTPFLPLSCTSPLFFTGVSEVIQLHIHSSGVTSVLTTGRQNHLLQDGSVRKGTAKTLHTKSYPLCSDRHVEHFLLRNISV